MTPRVSALFRHPIKAHGREALHHITLEEGKTLRHDREWAVLHHKATWDGEGWASCKNFSRGAKVPTLMAIEATYDEADGTIFLTHPHLKPLKFDPESEADVFLDWVMPLMEGQTLRASKLVRVAGRGMTDTDFPSISINSMASLRALEGQLGKPLSPKRFRGNIWLDGIEPWLEHKWSDRILRLGKAVLRGMEPITRCVATTVNPTTGERDADTLVALRQGWGHIDFGLYARVVESGEISVGDRLEVVG